jgi:hypothetical protein
MESITLWKCGDRECLLIAADTGYMVSLVEGHNTLRHEPAWSTDGAAIVATQWAREELHPSSVS